MRGFEKERTGWELGWGWFLILYSGEGSHVWAMTEGWWWDRDRGIISSSHWDTAGVGKMFAKRDGGGITKWARFLGLNYRGSRW